MAVVDASPVTWITPRAVRRFSQGPLASYGTSLPFGSRPMLCLLSYPRGFYAPGGGLEPPSRSRAHEEIRTPTVTILSRISLPLEYMSIIARLSTRMIVPIVSDRGILAHSPHVRHVGFEPTTRGLRVRYSGQTELMAHKVKLFYCQSPC